MNFTSSGFLKIAVFHLDRNQLRKQCDYEEQHSKVNNDLLLLSFTHHNSFNVFL